MEDSQLVEKARTGDSQAFGELVDQHAEAVKGYCYYRVGGLEEARDLCQETFILAYTKLHQLKDPAKFAAWIRTIAANVCNRWLKSRREIPVAEIEVSEGTTEPPTASLVRDALKSLPDKERLAVVMHYVDGLSYGDIAEFIEVSKDAVRGRLHRGREMLRKELLTMAQEEFGRYRLDNKFTEQTVELARSFTRLGLGWSPDGSHILFLRYFDRGVQLWISNTEGADAQPISKVGWQENYGWSPDSKRIVYAYAPKRQNDQPGSFNVYDLEQGESSTLADGFRWVQFEEWTGWSKPVWHKDNKTLALLMNRAPTETCCSATFLWNVETGERKGVNLTHLHSGPMHAGSWSPDGSLLALSSLERAGGNLRVWTCDKQGENLRPITPEDWRVTSDARFCPTSDQIAFCSSHGYPASEGSAEDVWLINAGGGGLRRLTHGLDPDPLASLSFYLPEWTSDGRYVVCLTRRYDEGGHECQGIHMIDVETGELIRIMESDPRSDLHFIDFRNKISICPNGKRIAFVVGQYTVDDRSKHIPNYTDRQDVIFFYDIPTRHLHEIQRTRPEHDATLLLHCGYSWMPLWSPDGRRLLCTKARVTDMSAWHRAVPEYGRLYESQGSVWDVLQPSWSQTQSHLCFFDLGD